MTDRTPEQIAQMETLRTAQKKILGSKSVKNIYLAGIARKSHNTYGDAGEASTVSNYLQGLDNADASTAQLLADPLLASAQNALSNGRNVYEEGSLTPIALLNSAIPFYRSAINHVKVSDMLGLLNISDVHESQISEEQKDMYMADFAEINGDVHQALIATYLKHLEQTGIGSAIAAAGNGARSGLEELLQSDASSVASE